MVSILDVPSPHQDALLIRASAGTGKTFQLSTRLLQLLAGGMSVDRILATTFTRKAAGEILDRVLERLAKACVDQHELEELNNHLKPVKLSKEDCDSLLKKITSQLHRLRISTLDSFFSQLARAFAFELRLPGGWQLMDPQREHSVRQQAIQQLLDSHNLEQMRTMLNLLGKGEYSAGILREIENTVEKGASLCQVTRAEQWNNPAIPSAPGDSELDTALISIQPTKDFNKSLTTAVTKLQNLVASADWEAIAALTLIRALEQAEPRYQKAIIPKGVVESLKVIRKQAMHKVMAIYRNQTTSSRELLDAYHEHLESLKRQLREWTFEDVCRKLAHWLKQRNLPTDSLGFRLDFSVDHLLLDEFQDTSLTQWEVLQPFAVNIDRQRKKEAASFFCVGDTKQAIYGWRGGIAELFDEVGERLPQLRKESLTESRRSSQLILDTVNKVFGNLDQHAEYGRGQVEAQRWLEDFDEHKAHYGNLPGYVKITHGPSVKGVQAAEKKDRLLSLAASEIADLARKHPSGSIGILVRTNDEVGQMIDLLKKFDLDVSQEGGNPLTDSAAVEVILSLLTIADHPGNSVALFHVRNSPIAGKLPANWLATAGELSYRLRQDLVDHGLGWFLNHYCGLLAEACNQRDQQRLRQLIQLGFSFPLADHSRVLAFVDYIRTEKVALPQPAQIRVMNIHQSKGLEFDSVFLPNLNDPMTGHPPLFVAMRSRATEQPEGVIRYMSKELQEMLDDDWREAFRKDAGLQVSESLCLLYVAMTRAKHGLYIYIHPNEGGEDKATMGSLLQSTLLSPENVSAANCTVYEDGESDWFRILERQGKESSKVKESKGTSDTGRTDGNKEKVGPTVSSAASIRQRRPSFTTRRAIESAPSPSALSQTEDRSRQEDSLGRKRIIEPVKVFGIQTTVAALEGTIEHAWFAALNWSDDLTMVETTREVIANGAIDRSHWGLVDLESLWKRWRKHYSHPAVLQLFASEHYGEKDHVGAATRVETEHKFAVLLNGRLQQGSIDRLVLVLKNGKVIAAEIIDFKTDQQPSKGSKKEWIDLQVSQYSPQLNVYAEVVAKQFKLNANQIRKKLVLLDAGEVVVV
jgi:ATP-dependent exoDNAse (exonuclease V) beta subunit